MAYLAREPMKLSLEQAAILRELVAGIPKLAAIITAAAKDHRTWAFEKIERDFFQRMRHAGFEEVAARRWISSIIGRLQKQVEQRDLLNQKKTLNALHDELVTLAQKPGEESGDRGGG